MSLIYDFLTLSFCENNDNTVVPGKQCVMWPGTERNINIGVLMLCCRKHNTRVKQPRYLIQVPRITHHFPGTTE